MNDEQTRRMEALDRSQPGWEIDWADQRELQTHLQETKSRLSRAHADARLRVSVANRIFHRVLNAGIECGVVSLPVVETEIERSKPRRFLGECIKTESLDEYTKGVISIWGEDIAGALQFHVGTPHYFAGHEDFQARVQERLEQLLTLPLAGTEGYGQYDPRSFGNLDG